MGCFRGDRFLGLIASDLLTKVRTMLALEEKYIDEYRAHVDQLTLEWDCICSAHTEPQNTQFLEEDGDAYLADEVRNSRQRASQRAYSQIYGVKSKVFLDSEWITSQRKDGRIHILQDSRLSVGLPRAVKTIMTQ